MNQTKYLLVKYSEFLTNATDRSKTATSAGTSTRCPTNGSRKADTRQAIGIFTTIIHVQIIGCIWIANNWKIADSLVDATILPTFDFFVRTLIS